MKKINNTIVLMFAILILVGCGNKAAENGIDEKEVITINTASNTEDTKDSVSITDETAAEEERSLAVREEYSNYDGSGYCKFRKIDLEDVADFTSKAVIYYQQNPEEYNMPVDANIHFGEITNSANGDFKTYVIPVTIEVQELYSADNVKYSGCITPSIEFADNITGGIIPVRDTKGNDSYNYGITFTMKEKEYKIDYSCDVKIITGEYMAGNNGNYVRNLSFEARYTVNLPADYDGLVMKIMPVTEYRPINAVDVDSSNRLLDEEFVNGTVYIKL